ncbi:MAG: hypothetical protein JOY87_04590 [Candidatus Eremiobacteraeota bacterium]|nr:hypothetical protein [Candidatus Eremiobacteraeota bacterium]
MSEDPRHAGRSERRSIVLVTSGFIIASAALHIVLGGAAPAVRFPIAANPSVPTILIATLQTPPPAPRPTPRPSPTPTATQRAV